MWLSTPMMPGRVRREVQVLRRTRSVINVIRKVISKQISGLKKVEKKVRDQSKKESERKGKEKEKETAVVTQDKKEKEKEKVEEAWLAMISGILENKSNESHCSNFKGMPDLVDVDSDSECDPLNMESTRHGTSETELDELSTQYSFSDFKELDEPTIISIPNTPNLSDDKLKYNSLDYHSFKNAAYSSLNGDDLARSAETKDTKINLYDLGVTHHMSGFHHRN